MDEPVQAKTNARAPPVPRGGAGGSDELGSESGPPKLGGLFSGGMPTLKKAGGTVPTGKSLFIVLASRKKVKEQN